MRADDLRRGAALLIGIDLLLVFAYLVEVSLGIPSVTLHRVLDLDGEGTLAAWYTSAKLLLAGVLFLLPAVRDRPPRVGTRGFLALVGIVFLFLSLDETAGVHELMTVTLRRFESLPRFRGDHGLWIPFLLAGGVAFMAATIPSWRRLWRDEPAGTGLLGAGLALGVTGAVGLEIVSYEIVRPAGDRMLYLIEVAAEEGLEMLGASVLLVGSARVFRSAVADASMFGASPPC